MGPKNKDPNKIPKGNKEANEPACNSFRLNLSIKDGNKEPKLINTTPNKSIPEQAAAKTFLKL